MPTLSSTDRKVLDRYSRAIMHLRDREQAARLVFGLGAGVSLDLGFPSWDQLVTRLAGQPHFKGASLPTGGSLTIRTQALIQHLEQTVGSRFAASAETEREVRFQWIKLLHTVLYDGVHEEPAELCRLHPYLGYFLGPIKKAHGPVSRWVRIQ
jgi:hypothetical protein